MSRDYDRLRAQDKQDVNRMARTNSSYLHHSVGTPQCADPTVCKLCHNAARLAVQYYRPVIEKRIVGRLVEEYDAGCSGPHFGDDG